MVDQHKGKGVMGGDNQDKGSTRKFQCEFCRQQFYSSQSLGGHQNAHKKERAASKKAKQAAELLSMTTTLPSPLHHHYPFMFSPQPYSSQNNFQPSYNVNPHSSHNSERFHPYDCFHGDPRRTVNNGSTVLGGNILGHGNMPMNWERICISEEDSGSKAVKWISMMTPMEAASEVDARQFFNMSRTVEKEIDENKLDLSLHL